jgi:hypothetical protein
MSRAKSTRNPKAARRAARPAARKGRSSRKAISARARRSAPRRSPATGTPERAAVGAALRRATAAHPMARMAAGWSTLRVVWRPAIAMATLPYRVYRVYRWAEAERARSASF